MPSLNRPVTELLFFQRKRNLSARKSKQHNKYSSLVEYLAQLIFGKCNKSGNADETYVGTDICLVSIATSHHSYRINKALFLYNNGI